MGKFERCCGGHHLVAKYFRTLSVIAVVVLPLSPNDMTTACAQHSDRARGTTSLCSSIQPKWKRLDARYRSWADTSGILGWPIPAPPAISPSGAALAALRDQSTLLVWTIGQSSAPKRIDLAAKTSACAVVAFSPDESVVVCCGYDDPYHVVDVSLGRVMYTTAFVASSDAEVVGRAVFSENGTLLAVLRADGAVVVLDVRSGRIIAEITDISVADRLQGQVVPKAPFRVAVFAFIGNDSISMIDEMGRHVSWKVRTGGILQNQRLQELVAIQGRYATISRRARRVGQFNRDAVTVWDTLSGAKVAELPVDSCTTAELSPTGDMIAVARKNAPIFVQRLGNAMAERVELLGHGSDIERLMWTNDDRALAGVSTNGGIYIWDVATSVLRRECQAHDRIEHLQFSKTGDRFGCISQNRITVHNSVDGREITGIHGQGVKCFQNDLNDVLSWRGANGCFIRQGVKGDSEADIVDISADLAPYRRIYNSVEPVCQIDEDHFAFWAKKDNADTDILVVDAFMNRTDSAGNRVSARLIDVSVTPYVWSGSNERGGPSGDELLAVGGYFGIGSQDHDYWNVVTILDCWRGHAREQFLLKNGLIVCVSMSGLLCAAVWGEEKSSEKWLTVWNISDRGWSGSVKMQRRIGQPERRVCTVAIDGVRGVVFVGLDTGQIQVWNIDEQREVSQLVGGVTDVTAIGVFRDGTEVIASFLDSSMAMWAVR